EAYIGVLIDDLVTKGVDEPYRMFTSRAEYRILLRQDNADERLTRKGYSIGLARQDRLMRLENKEYLIEKIIKYLNGRSVEPAEINEFLKEQGTKEISQKVKAVSILMRPKIDLRMMLKTLGDILKNDIYNVPYINEIIESAEIKIKYQGYIERERNVADKIRRLENIKIPEDINYEELVSISTEGRQKLAKIKPMTIGQASRISGVSPSDVSVLLMYLGR
ncbi:MAG: tRNA uridine-5-carboxymethylaminomethyl(34) synthesis enzyme MnmG, partial [Bacteroidales bacterium]|nr:tRNA uridine-5-carboxymethylaminomethyl(34) synthesis enzyme MnmG [Bacteroidales bacterium]